MLAVLVLIVGISRSEPWHGPLSGELLGASEGGGGGIGVVICRVLLHEHRDQRLNPVLLLGSVGRLERIGDRVNDSAQHAAYMQDRIPTFRACRIPGKVEVHRHQRRPGRR